MEPLETLPAWQWERSSWPSYVHNLRTGAMESMTYGNGDTVQYLYNDLDQVTEVKYNGSTRFVYTYTGDGQLYEARDVLLGLTHTAVYDSLGRMIYFSTSDDSGTLLYTSAAYDDANRLSAYSYSGAGLPVRNQSYTYSTETGLLSTATLGTGETATYVYDGLERVSGVNVTGNNNAAVYAMTVEYADPSGTSEGNTTELISDLTYTRGGTTLLDLNYTYDSMGRISSDGTYTYTYDALGQLKTVKNSSGATVASLHL